MGPYVDEALQYGEAFKNILNPPDEENAIVPVKATAVSTAPGQGQAQPGAPNPSSPAAAPVTPSVPATVTRSGNDKGATPAPPGQKSWADYVRGANDASMQNLDASGKAAEQLRSMPSAATKNAPLEAQRTSMAQPTPYRDPKTGQVLPGAEGYKPGIGTRIARGLAAARTGGLPGVIDPSSVGATPYGAPNGRYATAEAQRQAQVSSIDQQMKQNETNEKTETERLGKIGTEERANATGLKDVAASATNQQNAESNAQIREANAGKAEAQEEAARNKLPTNFESSVVAWATEKDPEKKAQLKTAVDEMRKMEVKKFEYNARATGGGKGPNEDLRQPMIDEATEKVNKLNDYQFDPEANDGRGGFYDPTQPNKVYTPDQFVNLKNQIATKLDADLAKKKLQPLRVRFNTKDTVPGVGADGGLTPPGQKAQPATPAQASTSGDSTKYVGEPTAQELGSGVVYRKGDQTVVLRDGAYRDVKTGKVVR